MPGLEPSTSSADASNPNSTPSSDLPTESGALTLEASGLEFDATASSPDYDTPTIPEMDDNSHKTLDFDTLPSKVCKGVDIDL